MSTSYRLNQYTDFDRLLLPKVFIITLLGSGGAFALSFFEIYIPVPLLGSNIDLNLSLTFAVMLMTTIYCKNIASSMLVSLIGSIGLLSPAGNGAVEWILGYVVVIVSTFVVVGYYASRLKLVMQWNRFYLLFSALFSIFSIALGIIASQEADLYTDRGIETGLSGSDLGTGLNYPIIDLAIGLGILLFILIIFLIIRGQQLLTPRTSSFYSVFGYLSFLIGQALSLVPIIYWFDTLSRDQLLEIARIDRHLNTIDDIFLHQTDGPYMIFLDPLNVFFVMAATVTLTSVGLIMIGMGRNKGNLEGMRGGGQSSYLFPPMFLISFLVFGNYYLQNFLAPGGFFVSYELFPVFVSILWTVAILNQWVARIVLFVLERF